MNAVAHRPVKEACADLCFVHIAPDAEILHVHDPHTTPAIESRALRSKLAAAGWKVPAIKGSLPTIVAFCQTGNILFLIEVAEESAAITPKRKSQLTSVFGCRGARCLFVTAFQNRDALSGWEEADTSSGSIHWFAVDPSHAIHYGLKEITAGKVAAQAS